jgi:hypothetical protein
MHCIAYRMPFEMPYRTLYAHSFLLMPRLLSSESSGGNDVNRNDRAYDKAYDREDCLGTNLEKQLRNMSD